MATIYDIQRNISDFHNQSLWVLVEIILDLREKIEKKDEEIKELQDVISGLEAEV